MTTTDNTNAVAALRVSESFNEQLGRSHDIRALIAGVKSIVEGLTEEESEDREHAIRLLWKADQQMQLIADAIDSASLVMGRNYLDPAFETFLAGVKDRAKAVGGD